MEPRYIKLISNTQKKTIDDLTFDNWRQIAKYLDQHDLEHLGQTCKKFQVISKIKSTKKTITDTPATLFNQARPPLRNHNLHYSSEEIKLKFFPKTDAFTRVMVNINQQLFAVGMQKGVIGIWNHETQYCERRLVGMTQDITALCVIPSENIFQKSPILISGGKDGSIEVWNIQTWRCLNKINAHNHCITGLVVSPEHGVISAAADKTIKIWNPLTGQCIGTLLGHKGPIMALALHGEQEVATTSTDKTLKIWSLNQRKCINTIDLPTAGLYNGLLSLPNQRLVYAANNYKIVLLDLNGTPSFKSIPINGFIYGLNLLPTGEILSVHDNHYLQLWNSENLELISCIPFMNYVSAATVLHDGKIACTVGSEALAFISYPFLYQPKHRAKNNYHMLSDDFDNTKQTDNTDSDMDLSSETDVGNIINCRIF